MRWNAIFLVVAISTTTALTAQAQIQHWSYDFGTAVDSCTQGVSTTLLPTAPAGTTRVRIGNQGGGAYLEPSVSGGPGHGSECRLRAPTGGSVNKVQLYDFPSGEAFSLRCRMRIDSMPGDVYLFAGNGSCFSDNGGFSSAEVFTGLRFKVDSNGTIALAMRKPSGWSSISGSPVQCSRAFTVELYCNNAATAAVYAHDSAQTIGAYSCDLWIDDIRVANNVVKTGLPDSVGIDSFMWYAAQSPANTLSLRIDDVHYLNRIATQPLPVTWQYFHAYRRDGYAYLTWSTETELQNYGFFVERRTRSDSSSWQTLHFLPGAGCSNVPQHYAWTDSSVRADRSYFYRLRQQDRDGGVNYSPLCRLTVLPQLQQSVCEAPWPQPASSMLHLPLPLSKPSRVHLRIMTLTGETVAERTDGRLLPAGRHVLPLPCATWPRGLLIAALRVNNRCISFPILLK